MISAEEMKQIINTEIPFNDLDKDTGIYVFYEVGNISAGVSYETNDDGNDRYIYNLFWMDDVYINIEYTEDIDEIIKDLVEEWNKLEKLNEPTVAPSIEKTEVRRNSKCASDKPSLLGKLEEYKKQVAEKISKPQTKSALKKHDENQL